MSKHDKNKEPGDNCMLASKPITGYRCASCETYIGDLKNNTQYLPWNRFHMQDMVIKPYRVGNGFSYFLQNINLDNSPKNGGIEEVESIINLKNNYNTLNNSTSAKSKINKNILPSVSSNITKTSQNGKKIIEIKPNFNTDDINPNNTNIYNTFFTKTDYNIKFLGQKNRSNTHLTKRNKKSSNYLAQSNNSYGNTKNLNNRKKDKEKDKDEDNSIKLLNIKKMEKDYIEGPINITERKKKEIKFKYNNIK
jgi:hypothetical protein